MMLLCLVVTQNHRTVCIGKGLLKMDVQLHCRGYGRLWLIQVAQSCIHPSLEHFQGQCIHNVPRQLQSSVLPHPHSKKFFFFSCIQFKAASFSSNLLLMLMLLLILVKSLVLSALWTSFTYWQAVVSLPGACLLFSRMNLNSVSLLSQDRCSSLLILRGLSLNLF